MPLESGQQGQAPMNLNVLVPTAPVIAKPVAYLRYASLVLHVP